MKNSSLKLILSSAIFLLITASSLAANDNPLMNDSIVQEAIQIFNKSMQLSKDLYSKTDEYKAMFLSHNSGIYCDYCQEDEMKDRANYVLDLNSHLKNGYDFTYAIEESLVEKIEADYLTYRVEIPFTKKVNGKEDDNGTFRKGVPVSHNLKAVVLIDYINKRKRIINIEEFETTVTPELFAELSAAKMLNDIVLDTPFELEDTDGVQYGIGLNYYFNPASSFSKFQTKKFAFKVGLRLDRYSYELGFFSYVDVQDSIEVEIGLDNDSFIDVKTQFNDLKETNTITKLTIPVGLSKKWAIKDAVNWQTDLTAGVQLQLKRSTVSRYQLEEEGLFYTNQNMGSSVGTPINSLTPSFPIANDSGEDFQLLDDAFGYEQKSDLGVNAILSLQNGVVWERERRTWRLGVDISALISPYQSDEKFRVNRKIEEDYLKYSTNGMYTYLGVYLGLTLKN